MPVIFFLFNIWSKPVDRLLHGARALHHLRQKHFTGAKQLPDTAHALHQRTVDHSKRRPTFLHSLFKRFLQSSHRPAHKHIDYALSRRRRSFRTLFLFLCRRACGFRFDLFSNLHEPVGSMEITVEQHIVNSLDQFRSYLFRIHGSRHIHYRHIHPFLSGMTQE